MLKTVSSRVWTEENEPIALSRKKLPLGRGKLGEKEFQGGNGVVRVSSVEWPDMLF